MTAKAVALILCVCVAVVIQGCWSRKEITELAIVLGAGVDLLPDGRLLLTVQIARPGSYYGGGADGAGGRREPPSWVLSAEGATIAEAASLLAQVVPREVYWGHCIAIVFGEAMARHGIEPVLDFFVREREPRETMWVLVSEGEARDFLETYSLLEKTASQAVGFLNRLRAGYAIQLREFLERLASKGVQPVATRVVTRHAGVAPGPEPGTEARQFRQVGVSGAAVFRGDRLAGWLSDEETRGLLWVLGKPREATILVPCPADPGRLVSLRVRRGGASVEPRYDGVCPAFDVRIRIECEMVEQQGRENFARPERIIQLQDSVAGEVVRIAAAVVSRAQSEFRADIFGFGEAFHRRYKREWKRLKDSWDEEFARSDVTFAADVRMLEIGLSRERVDTPEE